MNVENKCVLDIESELYSITKNEVVHYTPHFCKRINQRIRKNHGGELVKDVFNNGNVVLDNNKTIKIYNKKYLIICKLYNKNTYAITLLYNKIKDNKYG